MSRLRLQERVDVAERGFALFKAVFVRRLQTADHRVISALDVQSVG